MTSLKYLISKNLTTSQIINRSFLQKQAKKLRGKILDLGCGNGEYSFIMAKQKTNHVTALDSSPELCGVIEKELSKKNISNITVVKDDGHKLPFKNNSFDAVFCNTVLEHVKDPGQILTEIHRVLKPGGVTIVSIPFLQEIHADPYDFQRYTPYGLVHQMKQKKFTILKTFADYGALQTIEYLLLGSMVWRLRGKRNFPFGYLYVLFLFFLFCIAKIANLIFLPLQRRDRHFLTMVVVVGKK